MIIFFFWLLEHSVAVTDNCIPNCMYLCVRFSVVDGYFFFVIRLLLCSAFFG